MAIDWGKIKAEYVQGGITQEKLAAKYGCSRSYLAKKAMREGWTQKKHNVDQKREQKLVERVSSKLAKDDEVVYRAATKLAQKIEAAIDMVEPEMLASGAMRTRDLTGALKDIADIKHLRSEADIREQEARIKRLQHEVEEQKDSKIEVVIANGMEDMCK